MSTELRTLPMHVDPVEGEAATSWLIALAARHHSSVRTLMMHLGFVQAGQLFPLVDDVLTDLWLFWHAPVASTRIRK